jgi:hypothetical protein
LRVLVNLAEERRELPLPGGAGALLLETRTGTVVLPGMAQLPALTAAVIAPADEYGCD